MISLTEENYLKAIFHLMTDKNTVTINELSKFLNVKMPSVNNMMKKFADLKEGDTLEVKFKSEINEVCQKKGCWMTLDLADDKEAFVKFKDYGFFVPKNA